MCLLFNSSPYLQNKCLFVRALGNPTWKLWDLFYFSLIQEQFLLGLFKNNFFWDFRRKTRWMNVISYMLYNMNFIARDYSFDPGLTTPTFFLGILLTSPIVLGPMFAINKTCLIKNLRIAMVICSELCHFKVI